MPLYLTSSFVFEDAEDMRASFTEEKERNIYSRFTNPNTTEFVEKMCKLGADRMQTMAELARVVAEWTGGSVIP